MTQIIPFPNQNQSLEKIVKQNFQTHQMNDVLSMLHQTVMIDRDTSVYSLFFQLALEQQEYDLILDSVPILLPNINSIATNVEWEYAYIKAMLETWQIEEAKALLVLKRAQYNDETSEILLFEQLENQLHQQEMAVMQEALNEKQQLFDAIENIHDSNFLHQKQLIPQLHQLNDDELFSVSQTLLLSKNFHPMLKSYVIDLLIMRGVVGNINMLWFGEIRTIKLDELTILIESDFVSQLKSQLQQHELAEILEQNMILYMTLCYPFVLDVYPSIKEWIIALEQYHVQSDQNEWFDRFEKEIKKTII